MSRPIKFWFWSTVLNSFVKSEDAVFAGAPNYLTHQEVPMPNMSEPSLYEYFISNYSESRDYFKVDLDEVIAKTVLATLDEIMKANKMGWWETSDIPDKVAEIRARYKEQA